MTAHKSEPIQFLLTKSVHCQQTGNENKENHQYRNYVAYVYGIG